jgi:hypothetical protein
MKRLACIFGRHRWAIVDHDEIACSRCGKLPRYRTGGAEEFGKNFADGSYVRNDQMTGPGSP